MAESTDVVSTGRTALDPEALDAAVDAALRAFGAAADLAALAAVRPAHLGDRAPVLLARRSLGALPGPDRAEAGKRVNAARIRVQEAFDARRAALADHRVRVPIRGRAESLNLATAAAVCLYASARVHDGAGTETGGAGGGH